jgi:hypothetical protein
MIYKIARSQELKVRDLPEKSKYSPSIQKIGSSSLNDTGNSKENSGVSMFSKSIESYQKTVDGSSMFDSWLGSSSG